MLFFKCVIFFFSEIILIDLWLIILIKVSFKYVCFEIVNFSFCCKLFRIFKYVQIKFGLIFLRFGYFLFGFILFNNILCKVKIIFEIICVMFLLFLIIWFNRFNVFWGCLRYIIFNSLLIYFLDKLFDMVQIFFLVILLFVNEIIWLSKFNVLCILFFVVCVIVVKVFGVIFKFFLLIICFKFFLI